MPFRDWIADSQTRGLKQEPRKKQRGSNRAEDPGSAPES
jgi:hypothetical protein